MYKIPPPPPCGVGGNNSGHPKSGHLRDGGQGVMVRATLTITGGDGGPPTGACCMADGDCSIMSAIDCSFFMGATYQGDGSSCDDPDSSCGGSDCIGDLNGDLVIDGSDLAILLGFWNLPGADLDGDGNTSGPDLTILLGGWGPC